MKCLKYANIERQNVDEWFSGNGGRRTGTLGVNSDKEPPHISIGRRKMIPEESNEEQRKYEMNWET